MHRTHPKTHLMQNKHCLYTLESKLVMHAMSRQVRPQARPQPRATATATATATTTATATATTTTTATATATTTVTAIATATAATATTAPGEHPLLRWHLAALAGRDEVPPGRRGSLPTAMAKPLGPPPLPPPLPRNGHHHHLANRPRHSQGHTDRRHHHCRRHLPTTTTHLPDGQPGRRHQANLVPPLRLRRPLPWSNSPAITAVVAALWMRKMKTRMWRVRRRGGGRRTRCSHRARLPLLSSPGRGRPRLASLCRSRPPPWSAAGTMLTSPGLHSCAGLSSGRPVRTGGEEEEDDDKEDDEG